MSVTIDWSKGPPDATHYTHAPDAGCRWLKAPHHYWNGNHWYNYTVPSAVHDDHFKYSTKKADMPFWSGVGIPPIGLEVQAFWPSDTSPEWRKFNLVYISDEIVVYDTFAGENSRPRQSFDHSGVKFRKVKTAAEIEAEKAAEKAAAKRKEDVDTLYAIVNIDAVMGWHEALEKLYDLGHLRLKE